MWEARKIEDITEKVLQKEHGEVEGKELFAAYINARKCLIEEILEEIKAVLPDLTDHGPEHVANVMDNAEELLGEDIKKFNGMELYSLILSILFHDTGNIFDRDNHQRKVATVYDYVRPEKKRNRQEKLIILKTAEAHCGELSDGSKDTLRLLEDTTLNKKRIRLCKIAAITRFADELAEGAQRTSLFMQNHHKYSKKNQIYHEYANITEITIDRGNERIAVTYNINVDTNRYGLLSKKKEKDLFKLIDFTYKRIIKLNQERQYAKHYCDFLSPFKKTTVALNFWLNDQYLDLELAQLELTDLVLPGDLYKDIQEYDSSYEIETLIKNINESLKGT